MHANGKALNCKWCSNMHMSNMACCKVAEEGCLQAEACRVLCKGVLLVDKVCNRHNNSSRHNSRPTRVQTYMLSGQHTTANSSQSRSTHNNASCCLHAFGNSKSQDPNLVKEHSKAVHEECNMRADSLHRMHGAAAQKGR